MDVRGSKGLLWQCEPQSLARNSRAAIATFKMTTFSWQLLQTVSDDGTGVLVPCSVQEPVKQFLLITIIHMVCVLGFCSNSNDKCSFNLIMDLKAVSGWYFCWNVA